MTIDQDALIAGVDLVGRIGAKDIEVGYLDDDVPVERARWYATARFGGNLLKAEEKPGPVEAVDALAASILEGGICVHCARRTTLQPGEGSDVCRWHRDGQRWVRGCEGTAEAGNSSKRKLAHALAEAAAPPEMVQAAASGYYSDFDSPLATPIIQLVADLRALGLTELAARAIDGEFDATKEESDVWFEREGKGLMEEMVGVPNRAQRRAARKKRKRG